jgi:hypothetical protein
MDSYQLIRMMSGIGNHIFEILAIGFGLLSTPFIIWFLYKFLVQRKAQEYDVPALDRIDAMKLDALVSQQVEAALKPMLQSNGYSEEAIRSILVRTSERQPTFRR